MTTSCARSVPGNLRDGVDAVRLRPFGVERGLDLDLHPHGNAASEQPHEAVVVLHGEGGRGHLLRRVRIAAAAARREDRAAVGHLRAPREVAAAGGRVGVVAALEQHAHAFVHEERLHRGRELLAGAGRLGGADGWLHLRQLLLRRGGFGPPRAVVHPQNHRGLEHPHGAHGLHDHDLAAEGAAVGGQIRFVRRFHVHDITRHRAGRGRREVARRADEHRGLRRRHGGAETFDRPALAERPPLLVHVREAPGRELLHGPLARLGERGGAGDARTVDLREPPDVIVRLRAHRGLLAHAGDD